MFNSLIGYFTGGNSNETENCQPQLTDDAEEEKLTDKTMEGDWIMVEEDSQPSGRSSPVYVAEPNIDSMPDSADDTDDVLIGSAQPSPAKSRPTTTTTAGPLTRTKAQQQLKGRSDRQRVAHVLLSDPMTTSRVFPNCSTAKHQVETAGSQSRVKRHNLTSQQPTAVKGRSRKQRAKQQLYSGANNDRRCQRNY